MAEPKNQKTQDQATELKAATAIQSGPEKTEQEKHAAQVAVQKAVFAAHEKAVADHAAAQQRVK